jgi:putative chitinase
MLRIDGRFTEPTMGEADHAPWLDIARFAPSFRAGDRGGLAPQQPQPRRDQARCRFLNLSSRSDHMAFNPKPFFVSLRAGLLGPDLSNDEVNGCNAILAAMDGTPLAFCAYALATAYHETAATMQPVREAYWLSESWRRAHLRYYPWYGRGYVQLTWDTNYQRADRELDLNGALTRTLDLAMDPAIAAKIMRRGMEEGWFAGDGSGRHTLKRHLPNSGPATLPQFTAARRIINGRDKDTLIARHALQFQTALQNGGWA